MAQRNISIVAHTRSPSLEWNCGSYSLHSTIPVFKPYLVVSPAADLPVFYSILFYPITLEGRRGTTDEFAAIPFHLDLFSAALVELAKSIPVHSLILSSHLFFCLPLFLFPFTVPCRIVLLNQKTLRHGQTILAFVS